MAEIDINVRYRVRERYLGLKNIFSLKLNKNCVFSNGKTNSGADKNGEITDMTNPTDSPQHSVSENTDISRKQRLNLISESKADGDQSNINPKKKVKKSKTRTEVNRSHQGDVMVMLAHRMTSNNESKRNIEPDFEMVEHSPTKLPRRCKNSTMSSAEAVAEERGWSSLEEVPPPTRKSEVQKYHNSRYRAKQIQEYNKSALKESREERIRGRNAARCSSPRLFSEESSDSRSFSDDGGSKKVKFDV